MFGQPYKKDLAGHLAYARSLESKKTFADCVACDKYCEQDLFIIQNIIMV